MREYIELKPIRESIEDYDAIEKRIKELFLTHIYRPLMAEFSDKVKLKNSKEDLIAAIQSGRITYNKGKFSGKFNATISKELQNIGARWETLLKCYSIPMKELPMDIQNAVRSSESRYLEMVRKIDKKLASIVPEELVSHLKVEKLLDKAIYKVDRDFKASVKSLTIAPKVSDHVKKRLAEEWQTNMHKYVKDFTEKEIKSLRETIQASALAGNRYESAVRGIQKSYGVTENKARFLARQETGLMMAKFKEARYEEVGINEYKWKAVAGTPQHPVRPRHKELSLASDRGKIFRFDDPPITSEPNEPARRNNPGEDFNCRCRAIPVVRFKK